MDWGDVGFASLMLFGSDITVYHTTFKVKIYCKLFYLFNFPQYWFHNTSEDFQAFMCIWVKGW